MESLYLLIPLSVLMVSAAAWVLVWAIRNKQFDHLDEQGRLPDEGPDRR